MDRPESNFSVKRRKTPIFWRFLHRNNFGDHQWTAIISDAMAPDSRVDVVDDDDVGDGPVSREKYQSKLCKIDELNQIIEGLFANEIKQISLREEVEN